MKRRYDAYRRRKRNINYDKKGGINIILNITFTTIPISVISSLHYASPPLYPNLNEVFQLKKKGAIER